MPFVSRAIVVWLGIKVPFDGHKPIVLVEELGSDWRVGHEDAMGNQYVGEGISEVSRLLQDSNRDTNGNETEEEKDDLSTCQAPTSRGCLLLGLTW